METKKKTNPYAIKHWSKDDKPREKLLARGVESVSNSELLGLLISTGTPEKTAVELGKEVLLLGKNNLNELGKLSVKEITRVKGIGLAKAITIAAALELGRRRQGTEFLNHPIVTSSRDVALFLQTILRDYKSEVIVVVYLNKSNKITHHEIVSLGGISSAIADVRVILKKALDENATSIILCHNHPSGNIQPSHADKLMTEKVKAACTLLDIKLLDHLIVSDQDYFSFADEGMIS